MKQKTESFLGSFLLHGRALRSKSSHLRYRFGAVGFPLQSLALTVF